ncbi:tRNA (adenosine(37)-N6)-dimethylallyltransferase MiaA [Bacillus sp. FJAT-47783]|uniref:tRNA (adenosine(37)-N6)-dimethylallyltransferase MiaA n=1 Tax=Bacillus sp. FJAT-47783 TaxID=2922712 RepID=UPI001FADAFBE|nr:tRNA (adenosine(37)-N6)-dimethylallyltransferase MiaA [Bacillus sp. FJAT-47783]
MVNEKENVIVMIGPTAVGKTKLSIELAKKINGEIISGDSMQIYKGMDIGTAKIKRDEMEGIPHHLIDIKEPTESFSVAQFQALVRPLITEISNRGKVPMIVGGTGLYIQSVIYDYKFTESNTNEALRIELEKKVESVGRLSLYEQLKKVDPVSAQKIHPNNVRRVIRALEIYYDTGKKMSEIEETNQHDPIYNVALIGLTMDRSILYKRINERVDLMVEEGLVEEVKCLYDQGLRDCQSIQAIGYKELYDYFNGNQTLDEAIEALKQNSRRYAKRQLTWFRNKMDVKWFDMTPPITLDEKLNEIFQYVAGKFYVKEN